MEGQETKSMEKIREILKRNPVLIAFSVTLFAMVVSGATALPA